MARMRLVLIGVLLATGCGGGDDEVRRTVFVQVASSPGGLPMIVSVGFEDPVTFEARTPIARNVRAIVFCGTGVRTAAGECLILASASVKNGDGAGQQITMCLTDAGERDCATSNSGAVSVSMTIRPESL